MLDSLKQLGIFFKYSPKRSRRLEQAIKDFNSHESPTTQIKKTKFGLFLFCETRWAEKHTILLDFDLLYKPSLSCLDAIGSHEPNWDDKKVDAYGLMKRITDSTFIACFETILPYFGYLRGISSMLQGSTLDVLEGHQMVSTKIITTRNENNEFDKVYEKMLGMAERAGMDKGINVSVITVSMCLTKLASRRERTPLMYLEYMEDKHSGTMFLQDHQRNIFN